MTQDPNLPDGCRAADIGRAMGEISPALDEHLDMCKTEYDEIVEILFNLREQTISFRTAFRDVEIAYGNAVRKLKKYSADWVIDEILNRSISTLDSFSLDEPDYLANIARDDLPSWEDVEETIALDWEKNNE